MQKKRPQRPAASRRGVPKALKRTTKANTQIQQHKKEHQQPQEEIKKHQEGQQQRKQHKKE